MKISAPFSHVSLSFTLVQGGLLTSVILALSCLISWLTLPPPPLHGAWELTFMFMAWVFGLAAIYLNHYMTKKTLLSDRQFKAYFEEAEEKNKVLRLYRLELFFAPFRLLHTARRFCKENGDCASQIYRQLRSMSIFYLFWLVFPMPVTFALIKFI